MDLNEREELRELHDKQEKVEKWLVDLKDGIDNVFELFCVYTWVIYVGLQTS